METSFYYFDSSVVYAMYTTLDKTIVGYLWIQRNYLIMISLKIARIILAVLTSITIVMLPKISKAQAEGKSENILVYTKSLITRLSLH